MRITQKRIARDLGVSLITVSRVFNNSGYVSQELRKKILDYAHKKAYEPHRASQVLVRNTTRTVAVFSSTMPEYFWDDIKRGVLQAANHIRICNYEVHYHRVPDFDTDKYCALLSKEIKNGLDAAAFVCQNIFDMNRIIGLVEKARIPYLMYNIDAAGTGRLCYIGSDYRSGGRLAANFIGKALMVNGTGRVLALGFNRKDSRYPAMPNINSERLDGFLSVMKERYPAISCTVEYINAKSGETVAESQVSRILKKYRSKTDAVYFIPAFNNAYHQALEQYDYRGIITLQHDIDDSALSCLEKDLLTAVVYQDPVLQGYRAVRTLETILESKRQERLKDIEIAHTLVFRENVNFLRNHYLTPEAAE
jgi:LacI family transcriptional regulator